jgi:hypothetical protein
MFNNRVPNARTTTPWARATHHGQAAIFSGYSNGVRYAIDRFYYFNDGAGVFESLDGTAWSLVPLLAAPLPFIALDIVSKRAVWPNDREILLTTTDGVFVFNGDGSRADRISSIQAASTVLGFRDFAPATAHEPPLQVLIGVPLGRLLRWQEGAKKWTQVYPTIDGEPPVRMVKIRAVPDDWAHPGAAFLICAGQSTNYQVITDLWRLDLANGGAPSQCPLPGVNCTSVGSSGAFLFLGGDRDVFKCNLQQPSMQWYALSHPVPPTGSDGVTATRQPASLGWDAPNQPFQGHQPCRSI